MVGSPLYATVLRDERPFPGVDPIDPAEGNWAQFQSRRARRAERRRSRSRKGTIERGTEGDLEQRRGAGGVDGAGSRGGAAGRRVWNQQAVGEGEPRRAELIVGGGTVDIALWKCPRCLEKTFATRRKCFGCGHPRPNNATWVRERWKQNFLPRDVQEMRKEEGRGGCAGEVAVGGATGGGKGRAEKGGKAGKGGQQTAGEARHRGAELPPAGVGHGRIKGGNAREDNPEGKEEVEGVEAPPGSRPKAAAAKPGGKGVRPG